MNETERSIRLLLMSALGQLPPGLSQKEHLLLQNAALLNREARNLEVLRMAPVASAARYSRPMVMIGAAMPQMRGPDRSGDGTFPADMPVGMDEGMVRLASVAGASLAKCAGILGTLKRNPMLGVVGVGGAGLYGVHKATGVMNNQINKLDDTLAGRSYIPETMKVGGIGSFATSAIKGVGELGTKVLGAAKKTGPLGALGAVGAGVAAKGLNDTTKSVSKALSTEAKPYQYLNSASPMTTTSQWGYAVPGALRY